MKRIFIFPTVEEAKAFLLTEPRDPVFVGGVGMAEIAAATVRAVKARKPQLAVLAGIAGACERTLRRGEVIEVVTERVAGIPARYAREYETTGPDLGLPLAAGVTVSRSGDALTEGPEALTDPDAEGPEALTGTDAEEPLPRVENMEGAAFFAVCEALGVACCEIRAVSNYVGEPFDQWAVGEAVENLTEKLTQIFGNNE
ncbi:phosphorylase [Alistipes sp.]|uniref:phosphorylase family protein n=1 Tax=Alistipes sp. TaxID=1872444 RepID=UPI003AB2DB06